jgi:hypothetical protein
MSRKRGGEVVNRLTTSEVQFPVFPPDIVEAFERLYRMTGNTFELHCYSTMSYRKDNATRYRLPPPTKLPACAIGWTFQLLPRRIHASNYDPAQTPKPLPTVTSVEVVAPPTLPKWADSKAFHPSSTIEREWVCVVDEKHALAGLRAALLEAYKLVELEVMRALCRGALV